MARNGISQPIWLDIDGSSVIRGFIGETCSHDLSFSRIRWPSSWTQHFVYRPGTVQQTR